MNKYLLIDKIHQMEPMFPSDPKFELRDKALALLTESAALPGALHPLTLKAISELIRPMNSYYSNLLEGHKTNPLDIEKALEDDYSDEPALRALQLESKAHIEVQKTIEYGVESRRAPFDRICSIDFLSYVHKEFYLRMPEEYCFVKGPGNVLEKVVPGALRSREVIVGRHIPPAAESLSYFLERFESVYGPEKHKSLDRIIAAAASHHRLTWIHPFLDGNGRVARLFSNTYHAFCGLGGTSLWSISRGFARARADYLSSLTGADGERRSDLDGRGCLSDEGLRAFCRFYLDTALDQVRFMRSLLDIDGLTGRLGRFVDFETAHGRLQPESAHILREACLRGAITRGDALRTTGLPERTARRVLAELLDRKLLVSDTPKGPVRIRFSVIESALIFPRLYPDNFEAKLLS